MKATVEQIGRLTVVSLNGRFDAHTAGVAREIFEHKVSCSMPVLIDMSRVVFVDSMGLSVLVSSLKHSREAGGELALAGLQPTVRLIFELTRLDKAFRIYHDRASAEAEMGIL